MVGRYVIMPDHVHFFCCFCSENNEQQTNNISNFMRQWKQWTSKRIIQANFTSPSKLGSPIWQKEYFDHLLRSVESYSEKWEYVQENPVRKKLVAKIEDWPWQGEIFDLRV